MSVNPFDSAYIDPYGKAKVNTKDANGIQNNSEITEIDTYGSIYDDEYFSSYSNSYSSGLSVEREHEIDNKTYEQIKKQMTEEIARQKKELQDAKEDRGWVTSLWNGAKELFGSGDKAKLSEIAELEKQLKSLETKPENLSAVYKSIMNKDLDINELNTIKESNSIVSQMNDSMKQAVIQELEAQCEELEDSFETAKNSNGWISGTWNAFKNWTGIGASSNKSQTQIDNLKNELASLKNNPDNLASAYKNITGKDLTMDEFSKFANGETSLLDSSKAGESVSKYSEGQKMATDIVADIASGIVSVGTVAIASTLGIAAAPFTAGASLGLVATGIGIGAAAGAATKVALKGSDCIGNEKTYELKDFGYDLVTGSINGAMGPVSNALGGAAGTATMKALGMEALETTVKTAAATAGKEVVEEVAEQTVKTTIKEMAKRTLVTGTEMVVDGAFSGATDGFARALGEGRIEDIPHDMLTGAAGGAVAAPIIGGGFKLAGKAGNKLGNAIKNSDIADNITNSKFWTAAGDVKNNLKRKVGDVTSDIGDKVKDKLKETKLGKKISLDYETAKSNFMNVPVNDSVDAKLAQDLSQFAENASSFVNHSSDSLNTFLTNFENSAINLSDSVDGIVQDLSSLNSTIFSSSSEKSKIVRELLEQASQGEDISQKVRELLEKGINITDVFDEKTLNIVSGIDDKLAKVSQYSQEYNSCIENFVGTVSERGDEAAVLANDALGILKETPETKAFKQLGDLPDRTKSFIGNLKNDMDAIQAKAQLAREKIIGGNITEGLDDLDSYYKELDMFQQQLEKATSEAGETAQRSGLVETISTLKDRIQNRMNSDGFSSLSKTAQAQSIVEESNIALSKFIQTMSSDETLPPQVQSFFKEFTSNCTVTRDLSEAQKFADDLYGAGKYKLEKSFGSGTIGETYLVSDSEGKEFVMKMLKKGVSEEKFETDRAMFTKYINEFISDEADKEYKLKLINGLFDSWEKELDYGLEAAGAEHMAHGAKRFRVAQTLEVGVRDGKNVSLVMEKADGVGLDTLLELLKFKNENPTDYLTKSLLSEEGKELNPWIKNNNLIEQNSWIKDTESYREALPIAYQKAQNEQAMFISKEGVKTVHGDPHGGNVFVSYDQTTQTPLITYIDTGNVVQRTNAEVLSDISLSLNMMIGNSEGIANSLLDGATLPIGTTKEEMSQKVAELLDERLYKAGVNLKDVNYTQSTMNNIMKELNIIPDAGNSNLMKATLQRIKTSREIFSVTGTEANKTIDIKDMLRGIAQSFKADPKGTYQTIKPIIKWARKNSDQTLITFFQMMFKNSEFEKMPL